MVGISPAYFLSLFSENFTLPEVIGELPRIAELGFTHVEIETFSPGQLPEWDDTRAKVLADRIQELDLKVSQFVGHHLLHYFSRPDLFHSRELIDDFSKITRLASFFPGCKVVTIPQPEFHAGEDLSPGSYRRIKRNYLDTLSRLLDCAAAESLTLALEILPGSLAGNSDGFLDIADTLGAPHLGYNFDTGHAWACKEAIALIPSKVGTRIACTHLSDNFGHENLSLSPGRGTVPWIDVFTALQAAGYSGPYDIEIRCDKEAVPGEYFFAQQFLNTIFQKLMEVHHAAHS